MIGSIVVLLLIWVLSELGDAKEAPECEEHQQGELDESEAFYHNN